MRATAAKQPADSDAPLAQRQKHFRFVGGVFGLFMHFASISCGRRALLEKGADMGTAEPRRHGHPPPGRGPKFGIGLWPLVTVAFARARPAGRGSESVTVTVSVPVTTEGRRRATGHLEGWDVLYNHPECYITKSECYITILEMLYNICYITHVI